jgi:dihydroneopterin aldolase
MKRPTRTTITLADMRFHVRIGILPHERELPQPLAVDLTVHLATNAALLDYRDLYAVVRDVIDAEPLDYLETIGCNILDRLLVMNAVASARVAIRKPHAAIGGPLGHAEVVVEGDRD